MSPKKQALQEANIPEATLDETDQAGRKGLAWAVALASASITLAIAIAVIYYWQWVRELEAYGYLGAFVISILGGATVLIPVPMLAVVFALGAVMEYPWLVGLAAALGETVGALTIYMTGYGGSSALHQHGGGRIELMYQRIMRLMRRRGSITLFLLAAVLNPFFYPASLAAGAVRFGIWRYFIIAFAGKTIKCLGIAYAGFWGLRWLLEMLGMPG